MRSWLPLLLTLVAVSAAAEDITTIDHKVYKNAKVTRTEPDGVVIQHSAGIVKIPYEELPADVRSRFNYDPTAARDYSAREAQLQQERQERDAAAIRESQKRAVQYSPNSKPPGASDIRPGDITLEAHEVSSGAKLDYTWVTSWGSYDRNVTGSKALEITLRNLTRLVGIIPVEVHFVSRGMEIGVAKRSFNISGALEVKSRVVAPMTELRQLHLAALGEDYEKGKAPPDSWYVIARANGRIIASKASSGSAADLLARETR